VFIFMRKFIVVATAMFIFLCKFVVVCAQTSVSTV
jgi:hypothetical protein